MKRALPGEIARVATKIAQLEKELEKLEECKVDIAENLFAGFDEGSAVAADIAAGDDEEDGERRRVDMRNLASWRRLNEFRSDIENERKSIEMEALRVENQIVKLKQSKQWLTDMSI